MEGKTPPAHVAQCQDYLGHKSIGAGCSNQVQLAQGHHLNANLALVQILHLHSWWSSQLVLVVFILRALAHLLMRILQLALCGGGACCGIHSIYILANPDSYIL